MPQAKTQVHHVNNFNDLVNTPFSGKRNAIGWNRQLEGDFADIVQRVTMSESIVQLDEGKLNELDLSEQGQVARAILLDDLKRLSDYGADPTLNVIKSYDEDDTLPFFSTDVYSFHVDRATVPTDTFLCTYYGESSDILPNAEATQKILIPDIRARLRDLYDGPEEGFGDFLSECFFDLHYRAKPGALPVNLGIGNLWRLATDHPGSPVAPCIHRAPKETSGRKRLLLIC